eukprot:TRINITY_DN11926_c0_g1_i2.p1 TRINITY_DN11926_c0_g1~~TRINITY_DN11926_c0_g1_i2.p1  ORF type:complete len:420 (+),score=25.16 TRINITY_DN11926_c0_g1_i2:61-1260(+)
MDGKRLSSLRIKVSEEQLVSDTAEFVCSVCSNLVARDPVLTECSHMFCGDCMPKRFSPACVHNARCPGCKSLLRENQVFTIHTGRNSQVLLLWRMLNSVKIYCKYHRALGGTCSWCGEYGSYDEHVRQEHADLYEELSAANIPDTGGGQRTDDEVPCLKIRVEEDQLVDESGDFMCMICWSIVGCDPILAPCAHMFCGGCMQQYLSKMSLALPPKQPGLEAPCPTCRQQFKLDELYPISGRGVRSTGDTSYVWQQLSGLRIRCRFHSGLGGTCAWEGAYGDYTAHVRNAHEGQFEDLVAEHDPDTLLTEPFVESAARAFTARSNTELSLNSLDKVKIVQSHLCGWYYGVRVSQRGDRDTSGWFPAWVLDVFRGPAGSHGELRAHATWCRRACRERSAIP